MLVSVSYKLSSNVELGKLKLLSSNAYEIFEIKSFKILNITSCDANKKQSYVILAFIWNLSLRGSTNVWIIKTIELIMSNP
jgi:hypothetical protein